jgi:hypothetical protein
MITSTSGATSASAAQDFTLTKTTPSSSVDSFAQSLLTAIEGYLDKSPQNSHFQIDIQSPQSQDSGGGRQFIVTVKDSASAPALASPLSTRASVASVPAAGSGNSTPAADRSNLTSADAYWAMQPPEVQALRDMPDEQRYGAAQQLARQGFTIDVPIMVNGWDPLKTMTLRQLDGYTWVPSGLQPDIQLGPKLTFPGLTSYDASNPPQGSIQVSTDFAIGTSDTQATQLT